MNLAGKTALVTGASRGIGAAIYAAFGSAGAHVIGTATTDAGRAQIENAGAAFGGAAAVYVADDPDAGKRLAAAVGDVDIAVANAGVTDDTLLLRMKERQWARVLEVNLTAVFRLTQALVGGMMKRRDGRIILISSIVAALGNAGQANYCAAKAGLEGYCRALAQETASRAVTVNAIAPGLIETDMTANLPPAVRERFLSRIPAGRTGTPAEVAAAAVFLASPAAAYITGQVINVNGGSYS